MRARARLFGHPIHQMLVPVPFGLFIVAAVLDIVQRITGADWIPTVSFWNAVIGVGAGLFAAIFGAIDWSGIPANTRAKRIGAMHGLGNVVVVALFFAAAYLRNDARSAPAPTLAFALEVGALALGAVTGWLGGELVDRLGVGVEPGAHVDAPNSLTHETP
ncbi:MAG: hypothetical protein JWM10_4493 [Myxococcaceae bacterium]|nr:hypothetical protein [Myxococcaceae bacterium]